MPSAAQRKRPICPPRAYRAVIVAKACLNLLWAAAIMHAPLPSSIPIKTLLAAYRTGIFPMSEGRDDPDIFWVEPRERAIIPLDSFKPSKSLKKVLRQDRFEVSVDQDFLATIRACAAPRADHPESWINQRIEASYFELHRAGHAHSIECRKNGELVGGLYGVSFNRVFCGESMFSRADNASKVALAWLVSLMRQSGFALLDCQFLTDHLASLGAVDIPQSQYLHLLKEASGNAASTIPQAFDELIAKADQLSEDGAAASSPGKLISQSFTQTS